MDLYDMAAKKWFEPIVLPILLVLAEAVIRVVTRPTSKIRNEDLAWGTNLTLAGIGFYFIYLAKAVQTNRSLMTSCDNVACPAAVRDAIQKELGRYSGLLEDSIFTLAVLAIAVIASCWVVRSYGYKTVPLYVKNGDQVCFRKKLSREGLTEIPVGTKATVSAIEPKYADLTVVLDSGDSVIVRAEREPYLEKSDKTPVYGQRELNFLSGAFIPLVIGILVLFRVFSLVT